MKYDVLCKVCVVLQNWHKADMQVYSSPDKHRKSVETGNVEDVCWSWSLFLFKDSSKSGFSSVPSLCLACRGRDLVMNRFNQLLAWTKKGRTGEVWGTARAFDLAWSVKQLTEEILRVGGTGSSRWGEEPRAGQECRFIFPLRWIHTPLFFPGSLHSWRSAAAWIKAVSFKKSLCSYINHMLHESFLSATKSQTVSELLE